MQQLFDIAIDADVSAAEWLRRKIADAWNQRQIENANPAEQDAP